MGFPESSIETERSRIREASRSLIRWFDTAHEPTVEKGSLDCSASRIDWLRAVPFILVHVGCIAVLWVGTSATAVGCAIALYALRMFAITGFYHRYFSHKTFSASRQTQFVFALIGAASVQRGPLWWAAHHRNHHRYADTARDPHSPAHGFFWSHMGWFLTRRGFLTDHEVIRDFMCYPELRLLDRFDALAPLLLAILLFVFGQVLASFAPQLHTSGAQLLVWGFFISTTVLFHATFAINSLAHKLGRRRYEVRDTSRNSWFLALLTFGEGWHNNHHFFPGSARQGFRWWEIDLTYYGLRALSALGIIHHLKVVPEWVSRRSRS